jgi:hypothetical protein
MSKTTGTALAIVPMGDAVEALVSALRATSATAGQHSPRINLLFPFVPRHAFESTAAVLVPLLSKFPQIAVQLSPDTTVIQSGKAWLAQVEACTMVDMLVALQMVAEDAAPGCTDLGDREGGFSATLTVASFDSKEAAIQAVHGVAWWAGCEMLVDRVSLLHRPSPAHAFRTVLTVGFGADAKVCSIPAPAIIQATPAAAPAETERPRAAMYQVGQGMVRVSFELDQPEAGAPPGSAVAKRKDKMLFVVDQSYSMLESYDQVKQAVSHMLDSSTESTEPVCTPAPSCKIRTVCLMRYLTGMGV